MAKPSAAVETAKNYYDSANAYAFYALIWGSEDIHIGLYQRTNDEIAAASQRTTAHMAKQLSVKPEAQILDMGSGFGGASRYLASKHGAHVTALNLSSVENERHQQLNERTGLSDTITITDSNFRDISFPYDHFDIILSQIVFFVAFSLLYLAQMKEVFDAVQAAAITASTGWFFILLVNVYLVLVIYLIFGRYGHIRLDGTNARPEFSTWSWFPMLFSAGMGIDLVFWSVAEPIYHFSYPSWGAASTPEAAKLAMGITFFHWGLHAWGLYALMALELAYLAFNRTLPLTIRSVFRPLLGERIHGPIGNAIDILAAVEFGRPTGQCQTRLSFLYRPRQYATDYSDCSNYADGYVLNRT